MDGYKIWCDDYETACMVADRLIEHGFSWRFGNEDDMKPFCNLSLYFGDERGPYKREDITYDHSRNYFLSEAAKEVKFNELTDNFLVGVLNGFSKPREEWTFNGVYDSTNNYDYLCTHFIDLRSGVLYNNAQGEWRW